MTRQEPARIAALQGLLRERDLDGIVVTTLVNVRYLTGFTGSNGAAVVPADGGVVLLTDGRYRDQAAEQCPDAELVIGRDLLGSAAERATGRWAVETHTLSVDAHAELTERSTAGLVGAERIVEGLREIKDESEVDALRSACEISVEALEWLWQQGLIGRTERQIARLLENRMLDLGAEAIAFETIVAAGEHSAIPHHEPTDRPLATGDLLKVDFGARVDGYHADCTRTAVAGPPAEWQREIHAAVRESQAAGVALCVEGTAVADVNAASRSSLEAAGWLEHFTTGLGHGVGLQIHEDPFIAAKHAGRLERRTVLTVEPGIYLAGRGGVRIEDTVAVGTLENSNGPEVLTTTPTDLLEIA